MRIIIVSQPGITAASASRWVGKLFPQAELHGVPFDALTADGPRPSTEPITVAVVLAGEQAERTSPGRVDALIRAQPSWRCVVVAPYTDRLWVGQRLAAGAWACLACGEWRCLTAAVAEVLAARRYLSPSLAERWNLADSTVPAAGFGLTDRDRQILSRMARGLGREELARELGVGVRAIDSQRRRLMARLGVGGVAELTRVALREGIAVAAESPHAVTTQR